MTMQKTVSLLTLATTSLFAVAAAAKDTHYDGSDPLLCTVMTAQACDITGCEQAVATDLNGVKHLVVDFKRDRVKAVRTEGDLQAAIDKVTQVDNRLFLQGVTEEAGAERDDARSWTMAIADPTGLMTLTIAGEEVAFVVFGACAPVE